MTALPFYIVTLNHPDWEKAVEYAKNLPSEALPELRLDLFPGLDPAAAVTQLKGRCLVSCRRQSEHGRFEGSEQERLAHLLSSLEARPQLLDLEWDIDVPECIANHRSHMRLLRSVHVQEGVFDLESRLQNLPEGDLYKWVGVANRLSDNAHIQRALAWARNHQIALSAFLMGPKGEVSRCMQHAWGGAFTYAAPSDAPAAASGQLPLSSMRAWRCHKLKSHYGLCAVAGSPLTHSPSPAFHNQAFQAAFKDLFYTRLESDDPVEVLEAANALSILGLSITSPLKTCLSEQLNIPGPINTLWRTNPESPWQWANTDLDALRDQLMALPTPSKPERVLVLGSGGVAQTSCKCLEQLEFEWTQCSRRAPLSPGQIRDFAPSGIIQATRLGMLENDPLPFPEQLEAARSTLKWAAEWVARPTAFSTWAQACGLHCIDGQELFQAQARLQSTRFLTCETH